MNIPWWGYVILAGLSWGTYVPIIFFGGSELSAKPGIGGRLMAIVCVGVAYLVLAIIIPVVIFLVNRPAWDDVNSSNTGGYVFAGLAGVMGAVGAICVVLASSEALGKGTQEFLDTPEGVEHKTALDALGGQLKAIPNADEPARAAVQAKITAEKDRVAPFMAKYRILIAPLIFSIAPIVNTLLASFWHPKKGEWNAKFRWEDPGLLFWLGILLVAAGTGLVLYAKEKSEVDRKAEESRQRAEQLKAIPTPPTTNH